MGDGGAGEVTVVTGASTTGGGMFLMRMSSIKTWSVMLPVSWR